MNNQNNFKVLVLANGEGTRLRPLTQKTNKGMLLIAGKPVLEYIIEHLKTYGYRNIIMGVGLKKEQVMDYFQDGKKFGVNIEYSISNDVPGTAGEIAKAKKFLEGEDFLLYYGDTLTGINLNVFYKVHRFNNALITTPVIRGIPIETSLVETDKYGQILRFVEKPVLKEKANIPIFFINKEVLKHPNIDYGRDFSADVISELIETGRVYEYDEDTIYDFVNYSKFRINANGNYHYDVGTLKRYNEICNVFDNNKVGIIKVIK